MVIVRMCVWARVCVCMEMCSCVCELICPLALIFICKFNVQLLIVF